MRRSFLIASFLLLYGLLSFPLLAMGDTSCLNCHPEYGGNSNSHHGALDIGCSSCHIAAPDKKHPSQKGSMKLMRAIPELCYKCHKKGKFQDTVTHPPVAEGKCTNCHDPHQSDFGKLLINDPPDLCYNCHDKGMFTKKYIHPVIIGRACNCHNVHGSNYPYLLSTTVYNICTGCHKAKSSGNHIVALPNRKVHPIDGVPLGKGNTRMSCATCHDPHSSDFKKLFPRSRVCRMCHRYY